MNQTQLSQRRHDEHTENENTVGRNQRQSLQILVGADADELSLVFVKYQSVC